HTKLAASLSRAAAADYAADKLPFTTIAFIDDGKAVRFKVGKAAWQCDLSSYECTPTPQGPPEETADAPVPDQDSDAEVPDDNEDLVPSAVQQKKKKGFGKGAPFGAARQAQSPDTNWTALIKDNNLYLRGKDGLETQLTTNGVAGNAYSAVAWSPDSKTVVTYRSEPGDGKEVYMIETSPRDQLAARLHTRPYPRPGDKFPAHEMWLVDVDGKKPLKVDIERIDF